MPKRIAIYRAMFGNYDRAPWDLFIHPDIDYFFFTDDTKFTLLNYQTIVFDGCETPALNNRHLKIMSHDALADYDLTIYIDSNIAICRDLTPLINKFWSSQKDYGLFRHPWNRNVEQEYHECVSVKKASRQSIRDEFAYFDKMAVNPQTPHTDNSIILRRQLSGNGQEAMAAWFASVKEYSGRDQISFPFIRSMFSLRELVFNFSPRDAFNPYFVVLPHFGNATPLGLFGISVKCLIKGYAKKFIWRLTRILNRASGK